MVSHSTIDQLEFIYDEAGRPLQLIFNGRIYNYVLNLQGDVQQIRRATDGVVVATYLYNAWGQLLSSTGSMAESNPIRYRGYFWCSAAEMYYLQSRFYDPVIGRFINADATWVLGVEQGSLLQYNLFAYCLNNPVNFVDPDGYFVISLKAIGAAIATAVVVGKVKIKAGAIQGGISGAVSGFSSGFTRTYVETGNVGRAVLGGLRSAVPSAIGGAVTGAITGGLSSVRWLAETGSRIIRPLVNHGPRAADILLPNTIQLPVARTPSHTPHGQVQTPSQQGGANFTRPNASTNYNKLKTNVVCITSYMGLDAILTIKIEIYARASFDFQGRPGI